MFWLRVETRACGQVHGCGDAHIETDFLCVNFCPLVPLGSFAVVSAEDEGGTSARVVSRRVRVRWAAASVLTGYLRGWSVVGFVVLSAAAFIFGVGSGSLPAAVAMLALAVPCALVAWLAQKLGRLTDDGALRREAYAVAAGMPVDVALLAPADAAQLRASLLAQIATETRALAAVTYREAPDPEAAWLEVALGPESPGEAYLCAALTLARLEWRLADGARRAELSAAHDKVWQRLRLVQAEPDWIA